MVQIASKCLTPADWSRSWSYMQKAGDTCDISPQIFLDFPQNLGWEREINTAPKPSPEVAPSKMEVAPS